MRRGELTKIPHCEATEMAEEACVWNQEGNEDGEHQRSCPCRYLDGANFEMGVQAVCLDRLHSEE